MANEQKNKIADMSTNIMVGNGSEGVFICTPGTPFVSGDLTDGNKGKVGAMVKLTSQDGENVAISSIVTNGVIGDVSILTSASGFLSGEGMAMEIEELTISSGIAFIYLKKSTITA